MGGVCRCGILRRVPTQGRGRARGGGRVSGCHGPTSDTHSPGGPVVGLTICVNDPLCVRPVTLPTDTLIYSDTPPFHLHRTQLVPRIPSSSCVKSWYLSPRVPTDLRERFMGKDLELGSGPLQSGRRESPDFYTRQTRGRGCSGLLGLGLRDTRQD